VGNAFGEGNDMESEQPARSNLASALLQVCGIAVVSAVAAIFPVAPDPLSLSFCAAVIFSVALFAFVLGVNQRAVLDSSECRQIRLLVAILIPASLLLSTFGVTWLMTL